MMQDPNPTDYPELEHFCDWLYSCEQVERDQLSFETMKSIWIVGYASYQAFRDAAKRPQRRSELRVSTSSLGKVEGTP